MESNKIVKHVIDRNVDAVEDDNTLVIELNLSQNSEDGLIFAKIFSSFFGLIGLFIIILQYIVLGLIFLLITLFMVVPLLIYFFHYKDRIERVTFDKRNNLIKIEKISPKVKILKELNITKVENLTLSSMLNGFRLYPNLGETLTLKLRLNNNCNIRLYIGSPKIGYKLKKIISKFIGLY